MKIYLPIQLSLRGHHTTCLMNSKYVLQEQRAKLLGTAGDASTKIVWYIENIIYVMASFFST